MGDAEQEHGPDRARAEMKVGRDREESPAGGPGRRPMVQFREGGALGGAGGIEKPDRAERVEGRGAGEGPEVMAQAERRLTNVEPEGRRNLEELKGRRSQVKPGHRRTEAKAE